MGGGRGRWRVSSARRAAVVGAGGRGALCAGAVEGLAGGDAAALREVAEVERHACVGGGETSDAAGSADESASEDSSERGRRPPAWNLSLSKNVSSFA